MDALATMLAELESDVGGAGRRWSSAQGDPPGPMYVVEEGRLRVFVEEDGERRYIRYLRRGDFFGELSLFKGEPRADHRRGGGAVPAAAPDRGDLHAPARPPTRSSAPSSRSASRSTTTRTVARVPLDFAEEMLPAELRVQEKVGPRQVEATPDDDEDEDEEALARPSRRRRGASSSAAGASGASRYVRQIDEMDCGAAALAMVCRHYGRAVSLARIRQLCFTSTDGTSLRALCRAATELGLAARSVKASPRNLPQMPLPAIVHWEGNHWVVLYDVTDEPRADRRPRARPAAR